MLCRPVELCGRTRDFQSDGLRGEKLMNILDKNYARLFIVVIVGGLSACANPTPTSTAPTHNATVAASPTPGAGNIATPSPKSLPASLVNAGEYGENIYDYAKANNWAKATARLAALKGAAKQLRGDLQGSSAGEDELESNIAALDKVMAAKDRPATLREANQTTRIVADMTAPFNPPVPIEVTRLDYEGRELEIWAEAKETSKLKATVDEMRRTWDAVRPRIEARGGAVEAKKFGELVARVEAAKTPDEYTRLSTPILDEVDNLEKVFEK